jgi:hypothetical protein
MKNVAYLALAFSFMLSACSTLQGNSPREPASQPPDAQSVELAHLMKGRSIKFRAYRKSNQASVLAFLEVKFRDCEARTIADANGKNFGVDISSTFVECNVDIESDPIKGRVRAAVIGNKRKFNVALVAEEPNRYNFSAQMELEWRTEEKDPIHKRWHGTGHVNGWLMQKISSGTQLSITLHELLDF